MVAVPGNTKITFEIQDNRGFRSTVVVNGYVADISLDATTIAQAFTGATGIGTAMNALTNAKLIKIGFGFDFDYAQEPASETGTYELVIQKARLDGGDGNGGFQHLSVPAPVDSLFLTTADNNLIVVDPAATVLTNLQAALAAAHVPGTPRGGAPFAQFFGGQLVQGKPRVRRVLQGA